mmetsp:Transcript_89168/g.247621  ORF Transcript_89168/g.247621 Transcript_89168/m.247621 type:complete len:237 (+) Transcript_89168:688-1398(+)
MTPPPPPPWGPTIARGFPFRGVPLGLHCGCAPAPPCSPPRVDQLQAPNQSRLALLTLPSSRSPGAEDQAPGLPAELAPAGWAALGFAGCAALALAANGPAVETAAVTRRAAPRAAAAARPGPGAARAWLAPEGLVPAVSPARPVAPRGRAPTARPSTRRAASLRPARRRAPVPGELLNMGTDTVGRQSPTAMRNLTCWRSLVAVVSSRRSLPGRQELAVEQISCCWRRHTKLVLVS